MDAMQQVWHGVNLLLMPCALAAIHASICKLVWPRETARQGWLRLVLWCATVALVVDLTGFLWTGHDGAMLTYGVMVVALAVTAWLLVFAPWRQRAAE